jgi:hypothetical protein
VKRGLLLGALVAVLGSSAFADAARQKLAVLGIEPRSEGDVRARQRTAALARTLTDELRARALESGFDLAPGSQKDLVELKLLTDCIEEAPGCMSAIGRQLGADIVLYGHLEKERTGGYAVTLNRLEVATRTVRALETPRSVAGTEEGMRKVATATLAVPVLEPASEATKLVVKTSVPANVSVNGIARGATGDGQPLVINDLPAGAAALVIDAPGFRRYEGKVDVKDRGKTDVSVTLERAGAAPAPAARAPAGMPAPEAQVEAGAESGKTMRVMFWTTLVATGVGVTAFTITGLQVRSIEKEQDAAIAAWGDGFRANGVQNPNDACAEARHDGYQKLVDICDRGERMATLTNVLIGVSAATAIASAIFYWRGYLAAGTSGHEAQLAARRAIVTPELFRNGAGLGAVVQF